MAEPTQLEALTEIVTLLDRKVTALQKQITALKGGKIRAAAAVPVGECIMGLDPTTCPSASPYRYQRGCRASSCKTANSDYYSPNRKIKPEPEPVPVKVKKVLKKSAPTKKALKK